MVQASIGTPSTCTVQAPQEESSQPSLGAREVQVAAQAHRAAGYSAAPPIRGCARSRAVRSVLFSSDQIPNTAAPSGRFPATSDRFRRATIALFRIPVAAATPSRSSTSLRDGTPQQCAPRDRVPGETAPESSPIGMCLLPAICAASYSHGSRTSSSVSSWASSLQRLHFRR